MTHALAARLATLVSNRHDIPDNLGVSLQHAHFPFQALIITWAGAIQASALIIVGITLVIAAVAFGIGKISQSGGMQRVSFGVLITCAIVAVVVGASFAITAYFANVDTGF